MDNIQQVKPKCVPPLDSDFRPAVLANHAFLQEVAQSGEAVPLILALERADGCVTRYATTVFPDAHPQAGANLYYAERLVKFLLWQCGGWKLYIGGTHGTPGVQNLSSYLVKCYQPGGKRDFDARFMARDVYEKPFSVLSCPASEIPAQKEMQRCLGRHLEGCRIGFDLGASDLKVSAVVDGKAVFNQEIVWQPRQQTDPQYHYEHIMTALKLASSYMPRLDAIGGSAAGIYLNNRVRVASLFRGVTAEDYHRVRDLFLRIRRDMNVPMQILNDGEVTALAGAMALDDQPVLGIAMGSSLAAGYVNQEGNITTWLNELAFAPLDYSPTAPLDEWSGDRGCGASYLSQQCVFRLAPQVGIQIPEKLVDAEKLEFVQEKLEAGHAGAHQIWQSMGVYLGYAIAHYADFYDLKHILILGRCITGKGGQIIFEQANEVLRSEFAGLAACIQLELPDEKTRRVGQAVAAASLPVITV